ncbi:MAG: TetR/AcrR family transcriptional regulator, partial [Bacteroidota bacterium]
MNIARTKRKRKSPIERKKQLLQAAKLVLLEEGLTNFTIDQVAQKADLSKGSVYVYYRSKDELLNDLSILALTKLYEAFQQEITPDKNSLELLSTLCWAYYRFYVHHKSYHALFQYVEQLSVEVIDDTFVTYSQKIQLLYTDIIRQGQARQEIKEDLEAAVVMSIIWAGILSVIQF